MEVLTAPPQHRSLRQSSHRIDSIDLLRGLVMIVMALDHTRDFFHQEAFTGDPLNMATTTPILFLTRWITHFCAPIFVFLAGTSAFLQSLRKTKSELSMFLVKRGFWLVLVEVIIVTLGISFDIHYSIFFLQTIWAIGISMMLLGLAIRLPFPVVLALGLLIVLGHNSLDFYEESHRNTGVVYNFLHRPTGYPLWPGHSVAVLYPFLPWTGLMLLGYCFGKLLISNEGDRRRRILTWLGVGIILFFILLRSTNTYGDPDLWSNQKNALFTLLSFINTHKYPPSLLYMCMTIGPALLFLAWAGNGRSRLAKIITVYGRVPFFYYILHFYLLHILVVILFMARGHSFAEGAKGIAGFPFKFIIPGEGYSLGIVYLIWISVVAALYPACKWFSEYKRTHRQWWLSYL